MRLPEGRPVVWARSACDTCHATLKPIDLVPIASVVLLRGRCRQCGAGFSRLHLLAELASLVIAVIAVCVFRDPVRLWSACGLGWAALLLGWIDWTHGRLPDVLTLPLLLAGLLVTWICQPELLGWHAAACVAGYGAFRLLSLGYRRLRGRDGLGAGDAKLLAAAGAWVGPQALPWVVLCAAVATLGLALATGRRHANDAIPFGPGLAASLWLMFLCAA